CRQSRQRSRSAWMSVIGTTRKTPCWTSRVTAKRDTIAIPSPAITACLTPSLPCSTSVWSCTRWAPLSTSWTTWPEAEPASRKIPGRPEGRGRGDLGRGGKRVVRGENEHQRIPPIGFDVEGGMLQGNTNQAQVPLPRQHAVDHPLAVGNLHLQGEAGIAC